MADEGTPSGSNRQEEPLALAASLIQENSRIERTYERQEQTLHVEKRVASDNEASKELLPSLELQCDKNSDVELKPKTPARKQLNSVERQKQIILYKVLLLREERQKRLKKRQSDSETSGNDELPAGLDSDSSRVSSPKKRKRVSFEF